MEPATAMLAAALIQAAAKGTGDYLSGKSAAKSSKMRSKEIERETNSGLYNDALQRSAELESHRLKGKSRLGKRKSQSFQDTSDLIRGAFNI